MKLFDEDRAFEQIVEEGMFPFFSNSFKILSPYSLPVNRLIDKFYITSVLINYYLNNSISFFKYQQFQYIININMYL